MSQSTGQHLVETGTGRQWVPRTSCHSQQVSTWRQGQVDSGSLELYVTVNRSVPGDRDRSTVGPSNSMSQSTGQYLETGSSRQWSNSMSQSTGQCLETGTGRQWVPRTPCHSQQVSAWRRQGQVDSRSLELHVTVNRSVPGDRDRSTVGPSNSMSQSTGQYLETGTGRQ
ncbi:hypothetical protein ACOMHN_016842 [Nucella lapillus]